MRFSSWLESKTPHVNKIGDEISSSLNLKRGPNAWNQQGQNCYEIASEVAKKFGYEPASAYEISSIMDQYKNYWYSKNSPWMKAKAPEPKKIPEGLANFVVRVGDDFRHHTSFELMGKEYNYGAASPDGFKVLFKIPLKKAS
jgi:hypothetical protein